MDLENQEVAATVAEDRAAQEAGFNESFNETPPAETPAAAVTTTEPPATTTEAPPVEEPEIHGIKVSELRSVLDRMKELDELKAENRKNFGQIGFIKKQIEEAAKNPSQQAPGGVRIKREAFDQLCAEYPELGLDKVFDLEVAPVVTTTAAPDFIPPQASTTASPEEIAQREATAAYNAAVADLDVAHPDRLQIIATPEYAAWLKTLNDQERTTFLNSKSPIYVAKKLEACKGWIKARADKATANKSRLESNLTPRGTPRGAPAVLSDEAAMKAGFDSVFT